MAPRGASKRAAKQEDGDSPAAAAEGSAAAPSPPKGEAAAQPPAKRARKASQPAEREASPAAARAEKEEEEAAAGAREAEAADAQEEQQQQQQGKGKGRKAPSAANPKLRAASGRGGKARAAEGAAGGAEGKEESEEEAAAGGAQEAADGGGGGDSPRGVRYFLMKSEPEEFSLDQLAGRPEQTSCWEGVRNAQARNLMRSMRLGDMAFFYHSSCKVPAVVGVVRVVREAYPDHTAFDNSSKYFDPRSSPSAPKWWMVDVQLVRRLARPVPLADIRAEAARRGGPLADMVLINRSRLSVQPVTHEQWERILQMER
ncbi:hypothetical protein Agub_g4664, partial [Astrephomene gubernaculifera]